MTGWASRSQHFKMALATARCRNIHMRDGLMTAIRPRAEGQPVDPSKLGTTWHIDQEEEFKGVTHDGTIPLMELKVSYCKSHIASSLPSPSAGASALSGPAICNLPYQEPKCHLCLLCLMKSTVTHD